VDYAKYGDETVEIKWAETTRAPLTPRTDKDRAPNGYAVLTLSGTTIKEEFFDENGGSRWSSY
jgi:hypothetical protein